MAATTTQLRSTVPLGKPVFEPSVQKILFETYTAYEPVTRTLSFRNADTVPRRFRIDTVDDPHFTVTGPTNARGVPLSDSRVAPGYEVCYVVTFKPNEVTDYVYQLSCITERERFLLPVRAVGHRPALAVPPLLPLPPMPVGSDVIRTFVVRNTGTAAAVLALSVSDESVFSVSPQRVSIEPDHGAPISVTYHGSRAGLSSAEVLITELMHGARASVVVTAEATLLELSLSSASLKLPSAYVGRMSAGTVTLSNPSDTQLKFTWHAFPDAAAEQSVRRMRVAELQAEFDAARRDVVQHSVSASTASSGSAAEPEEGDLPDAVRSRLVALERKFAAATETALSEPLLFQSDSFSISPATGAVWSRSAVDFAVKFAPVSDALSRTVAYLHVTGSEARIPLQLAGQGVGPLLALAYDTVEVGAVTVTAVHRYELQILNRGEIDGPWALEPVPAASSSSKMSEPGAPSCFMFEPSTGVIPAGGKVCISAYFSSSRLGSFREDFRVKIAGTAPSKALRLCFTGAIVPPTFHIDAAKLDFGQVPFAFEQLKQFAVYNTSNVPFRYAAGVQRLLDDGSGAWGPTTHDDSELHIEHSQFSIAPGEVQTLTVRFTPRPQLCDGARTAAYEGVRVVVDIVDVQCKAAVLPVVAEALAPDITALSPIVNIGEAFRGHPCIGFALLHNNDPVPARYTLQPQDLRSRHLAALTYPQPVGVIPPHSSVNIPVAVVCVGLGPISLPVSIAIDGRRARPLQLELRGASRGPRIVPVSGLVQSTGSESASAGTSRGWTLPFGTVKCLCPTEHTVVLQNDSPVPAAVRLRLKHSESRFAVLPREVIMQPGEHRPFVVTATLDDSTHFADALLLDVADTGLMELGVTARGVGAVVQAVEQDLCMPLEFGRVFTSTQTKRTLTVINRGRRPQGLQWVNATLKTLKTLSRKRKGEGEPPALPPPTFVVEPPTVQVKPGCSVTFEVSCSGAAVQLAEEALELFAKPDGDVRPLGAGKLLCRANFVHPLLHMEPSSLAFLYEHTPVVFDDSGGDAGGASPLQQTVALTNTTGLPLEFVVSCTSPALSLSGYDVSLEPGGTLHLTATLDPLYRDDRQSHVLDSRIVIAYRAHPRRDVVGVTADIRFPNVTLDAEALDFGHVLNETSLTKTVWVTNTSQLPADLAWAFVEDEAAARAAAEAAGQPYIPVNRAFDVMPTRMRLEPGESRPASVSFYAHPNRSFATTAVCEVAAGPECAVALSGKGGTARFRLETEALDFGRVHFSSTAARTFSLSNPGKVEYGYTVCVVGESELRQGVFAVFPTEGRIPPGERVTVQVTAAPGTPDEASAALRVQLAHFPVSTIGLTVEGTFSCAAVELPKEADCPNGPEGDVSGGRRPRRRSSVVSFSGAGAGAGEMARRGSIASSVVRRLSMPSVFSDGGVGIGGSAASVVSVLGAGGSSSGHRRRRSSTQLRLSPHEVEEQRAHVTAVMKGYLAAQAEQQQFGEVTPLGGGNGFAGSTPPLTGSGSSVFAGGWASPPPALAAAAKLERVSTLGSLLTSPRLAKTATPASWPSAGRFVVDFGPVVPGTTKSCLFTVLNAGRSTISLIGAGSKAAAALGFTFAPALHKNVVEGARVPLNASFTVDPVHYSLGPVSVEVPLRVKGGPYYVLILRVHITMPKVELKPAHGLAFGDVPLGHQQTRHLQLHNTSHVPATWSLVLPSSNSSKGIDRMAFVCEPRSGVLSPGERCAVGVTFTPTACKDFELSLPLRVAHQPVDSELLLQGTGTNVRLALAVEPVASSPSETAAAPQGEGAAPSCVFPPCLPGAPMQSRTVVLTNSGSSDIEVFCAEMDPQYQSERKALREFAGYGPSGVAKLPPRAVGKPLELPAPSSPPPSLSDASLDGAAPSASNSSGDAPALSLPRIPDNAPRMQGRAVNVVALGPPGSGVTTVSQHIAREYGAAGVIRLDEVLQWARSGGAGSTIAEAVSQHVPAADTGPAAASGLSGSDAALDDECARLLALPPPAPPKVQPPAGKGTSATKQQQQQPSTASKKGQAQSSLAGAAASLTIAGRTLPWEVLRDALAARLLQPDCAAAAIFDGLECSYVASPVHTLQATLAVLKPGSAFVSSSTDTASASPTPGFGGVLRVIEMQGLELHSSSYTARLSTALEKEAERLRELCSTLAARVQPAGDAAENMLSSEDPVLCTIREDRRQCVKRVTRLRYLAEALDKTAYESATAMTQEALKILTGTKQLQLDPLKSDDSSNSGGSAKVRPASNSRAPTIGSGSKIATIGKDDKSFTPSLPAPALSTMQTLTEPTASPSSAMPVPETAVVVSAMLEPQAAAIASFCSLPPLPEHATAYNMDIILPAPHTLLLQQRPPEEDVPMTDALLLRRHFRVKAVPAVADEQSTGVSRPATPLRTAVGAGGAGARAPSGKPQSGTEKKQPTATTPRMASMRPIVSSVHEPAAAPVVVEFPEDLSSPSRWVVPAGGSLRLQVRYVSTAPGRHAGVLHFGALGSRQVLPLPVEAVCAEPAISLAAAEPSRGMGGPKRGPRTRSLTRARTSTGTAQAESSRLFEFGPVTAGLEHARMVSAPKLRSAHSVTFKVSNVGLLPATIDMNLLGNDFTTPWVQGMGAREPLPTLSDAILASAESGRDQKNLSLLQTPAPVSQSTQPVGKTSSSAGKPPSAALQRASTIVDVSVPQSAPSNAATSECFRIEPSRINTLAPGDTSLVTVWALPKACLRSSSEILGALYWNALIARVQSSSVTAACAVSCVSTDPMLEAHGPWELDQPAPAIFPPYTSELPSTSTVTPAIRSETGVQTSKPPSAKAPKVPTLPAEASPPPVNEARVRFSPHRIGKSSTASWSLTSKSLLPVVWRSRLDGVDLSRGDTVEILPSSGSLAPGDSVTINATFVGIREGILTGGVLVEYTDAKLGFDTGIAAHHSLESSFSGVMSLDATAALPLVAKGATVEQSLAVPASAKRSKSKTGSMIENVSFTSPAPVTLFPLLRMSLFGAVYSLQPSIKLLSDDAWSSTPLGAPPTPVNASKPDGGGTAAARKPPAAALRPKSGVGVSAVSTDQDDIVIPDSFDLDFGKLQLGKRVSKRFAIANRGKFQFCYRIVMTDDLKGSIAVSSKYGKIAAADDAVNVDITFEPTDAFLLTSRFLGSIVITDEQNGETVHTIPLRITGSSFYSQFSLQPSKSLHFGPLRFGEQKVRTIELRNSGSFPMNFRFAAPGSVDDLESLEITMSRSSQPLNTTSMAIPSIDTSVTTASTGKAKTPSSKTAAKGTASSSKDPLPAESPAVATCSTSFGPFSMEPFWGTVAAGETQRIAVTFNPVGDATLRSQVRLHVSAFNAHAGTPDDLLFELVGESCVPRIGTDVMQVFEELHFVELSSHLSKVPHSSLLLPGGGIPELYSRTSAAYLSKENALCFGTVLLKDRSPRDGVNEQKDSRVSERVCISNPTKIPVQVTAAITQDSSPDSATTQPFRVSSTKLTIVPYDKQFVEIEFDPNVVGAYRGTVHFVVEGTPPGMDSSLSFHVKGEAALPLVSVTLGQNTPGMSADVEFNRVFVGSKRERSLKLQNIGVFPTVAHLTFSSLASPFRFIGSLDSEGPRSAALTLPVGASQEVTIEFAPDTRFHGLGTFSKDSNSTEQGVALHMDDVVITQPRNPYAKETIRVIGQSVQSELIFRVPSFSLSGNNEFEISDVLDLREMLLPASVSLDDASVPSTSQHAFQLVNAGQRPIRFQWPDSGPVDFKPIVGHIPPRSAKMIEAVVSSTKALDLSVAVKYHRVTYDPSHAQISTAARVALAQKQNDTQLTASVAAAAVLLTVTAATKPQEKEKNHAASKAPAGKAAAVADAAQNDSGTAGCRRRVMRRLSMAPSEPVILWDSEAVEDVYLSLDDSEAGDALASGTGQISTDGCFIVRKRSAPEPSYAVINDTLDVLQSSAGGTSVSVGGSQNERLSDGGLVCQAHEEEFVVESALLQIKLAIDSVKYRLQRSDASTSDPTVFLVKPTYLFQRRSVSFQISNDSSVALPFQWSIKNGDDGSQLTSEEGDFSVSPSAGSVPPNSTLSFTATHHPRRPGKIFASAAFDVLGPGQSSQVLSSLLLHFELHALRPVCHLDIAPSNYLQDRQIALKSNLSKSCLDLTASDLAGSQVIEMRSLGSGSPVTKQVMVHNTGTVPLEFAWLAEQRSGSALTRATAIRCLTPSGEILPGRRQEVTFEFTPDALVESAPLASVEQLFTFSVPAADLALRVLVAGFIKEPSITLDRASIAFSAALIGSRCENLFTLVNDDSKPFDFEISAFDDESQQPCEDVLEALPRYGTIEGKSRFPVSIRFKAAAEQQYRMTILVRLPGKRDPLRLNVKGQGFALKEELCLLPAGVPGEVAGIRLQGAPLSSSDSSSEVPSLAASARRNSLMHKQYTAESAASVIDFGSVQVNESSSKRIAISNRGSFPFTFQWSPTQLLEVDRGSVSQGVKTDSRKQVDSASDSVLRSFRIAPISGRLLPGATAECIMTLLPTTTFKHATVTTSCEISGVQRYDVHLTASASRPALEFSAFSVDFGDCFLPPPGTNVPTGVMRLITLTNRELDRDIAIHLVSPKSNIFEVGVDSAIIRPRESIDVPITFFPTQKAAYAATALFEVNGLKVAVGLAGSGIPLVLELQQPTGGALTLGSVRLGDGGSHFIQLGNRSRRHALIELLDECGRLEQKGIMPSVKQIFIPPRSSGSFSLRYVPKARDPTFTEPLLYRVAVAGENGSAASNFSQAVPLLQLSGACVGTSVRLDHDEVHFGSVCFGSTATRQLLLVNDGDVDVFFSAPSSTSEGFFIAPSTGRVRASSCVPLVLSFKPEPAPGDAGREARVSSMAQIMCRSSPPSASNVVSSGGAIQLSLSLVGNTQVQPQAATGQSLSFSCPVRHTSVQTVTLTNPTATAFTLSPQVRGTYWTGPKSVTLPPKGSATCELTYRPVTMTAPAQLSEWCREDPLPSRSSEHLGTAFFPLPDGTGVTYDLKGHAGPPAEAGSIKTSHAAMERQVVTIPFANWLSQPQTLAVRWDTSKVPLSAELSGASMFQVPAGGQRDYKLSFINQTTGGVSTAVTFLNEQTGEYATYGVELETVQPAPRGTITLAAPIRGVSSHIISIENPLWKALPGSSAAGSSSTVPPLVEFLLPQCSHPAIRVTQLDVLTGKPQGRFKVEYRPLCYVTDGGGSQENSIRSRPATPAGAANPSQVAAAAEGSKATNTSGKGTGGAVTPSSSAKVGGTVGGKAAGAAGGKTSGVVSTAGVVDGPAVTAADGKDPSLAAAASTEITLRSPQLGEHVYQVLLSTIDAASNDKSVTFCAPLGGKHTVEVTFHHYSTQQAVYECSVSPSDGFAAPSTIAAPGAVDSQAAWDGVPISVPVTFEGTGVGTMLASLTIKQMAAGLGSSLQASSSPVSAPTVIQLIGDCSEPAPAGPYIVSATRPVTIPFRNPFSQEQEFIVTADAGFTAAPAGSLKIPAKGLVSVVIACAPPLPSATSSKSECSGKLSIVPTGIGIAAVRPWLFYLTTSQQKGEVDAAASVAKGGAGGAGGTGTVTPSTTAAGSASVAGKPSVPSKSGAKPR